VAHDRRAASLHERAPAPGLVEVVGVGDLKERAADQVRHGPLEQAAHRRVAGRDHSGRRQHRHPDRRVLERAQQVVTGHDGPILQHIQPPDRAGC